MVARELTSLRIPEWRRRGSATFQHGGVEASGRGREARAAVLSVIGNIRRNMTLSLASFPGTFRVFGCLVPLPLPSVIQARVAS